MEMASLGRSAVISRREHITNEEIRRKNMRMTHNIWPLRIFRLASSGKRRFRLFWSEGIRTAMNAE